MQRASAAPVGLARALATAALAWTAPASAFEAFDGRVQAHGFFETQLRAISGNYNEDWDLTQWYNIFNLELEFDLIDDTVGPFDLLSAYARIEARYDCVWNRACGLASSADTYGDRSRVVPWRLSSAEEPDFAGVINLAPDDKSFFLGKRSVLVNSVPTSTGHSSDPKKHNSVPPGGMETVGGFSTLFDEPGADLILGTADDPARFYFSSFKDFRFVNKGLRGPEGGNASSMFMGPWLPKNFIQSVASLSDKPNPFNKLDTIPIVPDPTNPLPGGGFGTQSVPGSAEMPFRPAPLIEAGSTRDFTQAQGVYYPSAGLVQELRSGDLDNPEVNFRQAERAWNRGQSQQQTKELKEAYFDAEFFEGRLWTRIGKQSIVWGKTELFRTTDQFNPQDLALSSLPSLEESRISLWAARFVYSLYDVGPLQDVRLEFAFNYDEFKPADLGACGEPYTINSVCQLTLGLWAHGVTGLGVAGVDRPENPWDSFTGWEVGGRVEWRWDRFSFALSDFWGYEDFPHPDRIWTYSRNVDVDTGRATAGQSRGTCDPAALGLDPGLDFVNDLDLSDPADQADLASLQAQGCLIQNPNFVDPGPDGIFGTPDDGVEILPNNALQNAAVNAQLFTMICSTTIGFLNFDLELCALALFNSASIQLFPIADDISLILSGATSGSLLCQNPAFLGIACPTVILNRDANDGDSGSPFFPPLGPPSFGTPSDLSMTIGNVFTDQQEALVGCGPYWGTTCDHSHVAGDPPFNFPNTVFGGIDLLNTEASFIMQSWIGIEGTDNQALLASPSVDAPIDPDTGQRIWQTNIAALPQPGTVAYAQAVADVPTCRRWIGGDATVVLPGCRGIVSVDVGGDGFLGSDDDAYVGETDYDPRVDGCVRSDVGAFFGDTYCTLSRPNETNPGALPLTHPFTGQQFKSEGAAFSWNLLTLLVGFSCLNDPDLTPDECFDPATPMAPDKCSFAAPQFCFNVRNFYRVAGVKRNDVRAGGTTRFGRRVFVWHSAGEVVLRYQKRNVLGFAMDWADDWSKANFSVETTWINDVPRVDNDSFDNIEQVDEYNLTISIDRPTFINFLNANRTFFFNSQWFFQYVDGWENTFTTEGPWNVLFTFTIFTGFQQDRLLPFVTWVYDFQSESGAFLPTLIYRFSEKFSVSVGLATFWGQTSLRKMPINGIAPAFNRAGPDAYKDPVQNVLSNIRDRDEVFLSLRYTF